MIKVLLVAALLFLLFNVGKRALGASQGMTRGDAAKLLEISPDADGETILAAHRRLIAKVHPDAGGSAALAAQVNQARDTLLRKLPR